MIYNTVTMIIKKGKMDELIAEYRKVRPLVLAQEGCRMYDYTREIETGSARNEPVNPDRITLYEQWDSVEALDRHSAAPFMIDFVNRINPLRESVVIRTGVEAF